MSKPKHYDLFGEELYDNDIVIAADGIRGELKICKVIRQTAKMVRVEPISTSKFKRSFLRYSKYLIKIEKEKAAEYVLMLQ